MKKALILVDIQNDFVPGGALAVPEGDEVVGVANEIMNRYEIVVATQDWHPADHGSFASRHENRSPGDEVDLNGLQQVLWPDHCVQNTEGAEFVADLDVEQITKVFRKGIDRTVDSYSGFFDNDRRNDTELGDYLEEMKVDEVAVMGLATDYCVKYTALDARRLGFATKLIKEGIRGVELDQGDCRKALEEMEAAGVGIVGMNDL
ncbi:MAG: bifunctional nicotinamidase/pyrazinamidase [Proteobacteria bacterium]|nr:bifunctional nicotinamidase/pyrazinamidase [Pseudomonadota bacterium]